MPTIQLIIRGKVQGVYYRASAKSWADQLGVRGWVRNRDNGDVEIRASGDEKMLEEFVSWCRQGPEHAVVGELSITELSDEPFENFLILRG